MTTRVTPQQLLSHPWTHHYPNGVEFEGKIVTVGAFPIGIDPEKFTEAYSMRKSREDRCSGAKIQRGQTDVGVDRLDYIKGVHRSYMLWKFS